MMRIALMPVVAATLLLSSCTAFRVAHAWAQTKDGFTQCTSDPRIFCEPGAEEFAKSVEPLLPAAVAAIEKAQRAAFKSPIVLYVFAERESFARHSGSSIEAAGAVSLDVLNLSPKLLLTPERMQGVLTHELSHLHLRQQMGSALAWARVPSWFHEGLATFVSGGGGAEFVSAADALTAICRGNQFTPDASQWVLFPKSAASYGLNHPHLFYRQAALFVGYLHDRDDDAFARMLMAVQATTPLATAIQSSYGYELQDLWFQFLSHNNLTKKTCPPPTP